MIDKKKLQGLDLLHLAMDMMAFPDLQNGVVDFFGLTVHEVGALLEELGNLRVKVDRLRYMESLEIQLAEARAELASPRSGKDGSDSAPVAVEVPEIEPELTEEPVVVEDFADNGAHSQWRLIDGATGKTLWEESCAVPPSRILKDGERAVPVSVVNSAIVALTYCRNKIAYMLCFGEWHDPERTLTAADSAIDALRSGEAEGGAA